MSGKKESESMIYKKALNEKKYQQGFRHGYSKGITKGGKTNILDEKESENIVKRKAQNKKAKEKKVRKKGSRIK